MSVAPTIDHRQRVAELRVRLSEAGHRITPQRIAILTALIGQSHPTADEIYAQVVESSPSTSLATVYKTLDTLKALGELNELEIGDGRRHYDALDPVEHPHAVCRECGKIEDLDGKTLNALVKEAERQLGFQVLSQRLEFFGLCSTCAQR